MIKNKEEEIKSHMADLEGDQYELIIEEPIDFFKILEEISFFETDIDINSYLESLSKKT